MLHFFEPFLGGGFKYFLFSPLPGEMVQYLFLACSCQCLTRLAHVSVQEHQSPAGGHQSLALGVKNLTSIFFKWVAQPPTSFYCYCELLSRFQSLRLGNFMESLGISTDDVFTLFMLIDANHNGLVGRFTEPSHV